MKCLAVHQFRSALLALLLAMPLCGCVGHRQYNVTRAQYLQEIQSAGPETPTGIDLAVIEFDEFGGSWDPSQLKDTVELIRRRNSESENGVLLWLYVHGWMNDANPDREENDLARFRRGVLERFQQADVEAGVNPDHVVAVYVGWRGASSRVPVLGFASFWERRRAAERVASFSVLEAIVRLAEATRESSGGKVVIMGHSMGGLIVSRTIMPAASAKFISNLEQGTPLLIDQVMLLNPAIEASYTAQIIEFLKRTDAHLEIGRDDGTRVPAAGPYIVSITSEADWVTSTAYELGLTASRWMLPARGDHDEGTPSQRTLATSAEGHIDYLVSHRAWVEDGVVRLERVEGAYNDTPFWVVRASADICADHGDIFNPYFAELRRQIFTLDGDYTETGQRWMRSRGGE